MTECTCNKCGWVHMAVTREFAEVESKNFLEWYDTQPASVRENYGAKRPDPMKQYDRCFFCGQTDQDFRPSMPDDCPVGCTIQPTIWEPK